MIYLTVIKMNTFPVTFAVLLAIATLGSTQNMLGNPGTEPWAFATTIACATKKVNVEAALQTAMGCLTPLAPQQGDDPTAMCSKKKERNNCIKPYYEQLKKCYSTNDQKKQLDKAFKAQDEAIEFMCEDNAKMLKSMGPNDFCQPKDSQKCIQDAMQSSMPDPAKLFSENNCKIMHAMIKCSKESFADCKNKKMEEMTVGQMNAILGETSCGEHSGVSSSLNAFVAPMLLLGLLLKVIV